jgi:hypothetical protein
MNTSAPEWNFPEVTLELIMHQVYISGTAGGSIKETQEAL